MLKLHYLHKCDTHLTKAVAVVLREKKAVAVVLREKRKNDSSKSDWQGGECKAMGGEGGLQRKKESSSFYDIFLLRAP